MSAPGRYPLVSRLLHWGMAVLLLGLLVLGTVMHELPLSPLKLQLYAWHKWAGVSAFVLVLVRLAWRWWQPPPASNATHTRWMRRTAALGHAGLYLCMVLLPLSGWLMSSAKGFQTVWFGVLPIPDLIGKDRFWGDVLQEVHEALSQGLWLLLVLHLGAALFHHFILKDDTLQRMR